MFQRAKYFVYVVKTYTYQYTFLFNVFQKYTDYYEKKKKHILNNIFPNQLLQKKKMFCSIQNYKEPVLSY